MYILLPVTAIVDEIEMARQIRADSMFPGASGRLETTPDGAAMFGEQGNVLVSSRHVAGWPGVVLVRAVRKRHSCQSGSQFFAASVNAALRSACTAWRPSLFTDKVGQACW